LHDLLRQIGALLNPRIRQILLFTVLVCSVLSVCAVKLWSRLMAPPSMADVRDLAEKAPIVFRGRVAGVSFYGKQSLHTIVVNSIATFDVDRLYRGSVPAEPMIHFVYSGSPNGVNGHDCIDFQPDTYWLVFAVEKGGRFELYDDCEGALAISPLLGPHHEDAGWLSQMEADFLAGLNDGDPAKRIVSMQRLGGLKLPSSRNALHRVIDGGDETEARWAVYAALRTGDISVLPKVKQILSVGEGSSPAGAIAFELQNVSDPKAVPDLIAILDSAPGDLTRSRVLIALAEKIKDPRSVPSLAAHLSDPDEGSRYLALEGLKNITQEFECTLPESAKAQRFESQIRRCKLWWDDKGKFQSWTQN
jgi:hypothetical protein